MIDYPLILAKSILTSISNSEYRQQTEVISRREQLRQLFRSEFRRQHGGSVRFSGESCIFHATFLFRARRSAEVVGTLLVVERWNMFTRRRD